MEKIKYDDSTYIWKTKLNLINEKQLFLQEANSIIQSMPYVKSDSFPYKKELTDNLNLLGKINIESKLDEIVQIAVNKCIEIYNEKNISYDKINTDFWINIVRSKNPIQSNFYINEKYHIHNILIDTADGQFIPYYTWVYYIQMPDVMYDNDGVLYFLGENDKEYWIKPQEDDLIIMKADVPHAPNSAPKSTLDRIVIAGSVGFDSIKKEKTLI